MEINKTYIQDLKNKKGANNKHAELVFGYFKKWNVDVKNDWGKKMTGAMMRTAKKYGRGVIERKMGIADESLEYMKRNFPKKFDAIMKTNTSKQKYFWNKLMK